MYKVSSCLYWVCGTTIIIIHQYRVPTYLGLLATSRTKPASSSQLTKKKRDLEKNREPCCCMIVSWREWSILTLLICGRVCCMMPRTEENEYTLAESGTSALIANMGSALAVVITHPWGPLGGNMHNNVVMGVAFWFQRFGITTMRFDFCGSQIGRGYRQVQQVQEACNFLLDGHHISNPNGQSKAASPPKYILLVGYSYGSIISASASASIPKCVGVVSIAPPLAVRHWLYIFHGNYHLEQSKQRPNLPRLMVIGSKDNFTSENVFMDIVQTMPKQSTTGAVLKDADHFFRRREKDLMDIIGHWILNTFPQCERNLKNLSTIEFILHETKIESSRSTDLGYGCNPCAPEL